MCAAPQPTTIDGVVRVLDQIINDCIQRRSRLGFFAALYRRVTVGVRRRLEEGTYVDARRMERLDVRFAQRYIDAYFRHRRGEDPTAAWAYTFAAGQDDRPLVLQHLLLGMNAHIHLDLPVASAQVLDRHDPEGFKADFHAVNDLLADLVDEIQDEIATAGMWMKVVDVLGGPVDEALCSMFLSRARSSAWQRALRLHDLEPRDRPDVIRKYDENTRTIARRIYAPDSAISGIRSQIRAVESDDVCEVIEAMR